MAHLKFTLVSMCVPNLIKIGGGREFHWLISYGMTPLLIFTHTVLVNASGYVIIILNHIKQVVKV